jgi:hypothetical protein
VYHRISIIGSVASFELEISAFVYHRISIIGSVQPPPRSPLAGWPLLERSATRPACASSASGPPRRRRRSHHQTVYPEA